MSAEVLTTLVLLHKLTGWFQSRNISSPRLDAELLLAHVLQCSRTDLYMRFDQPIAKSEQDRLRTLAKRRASFEPIAYLVGAKEFFGRLFKVNEATLIPRPETEHIVEAALAFHKAQSLVAPRVLDVGTGSGVLAISLLCAWPDATAVATDVSQEALAVAKDNAEHHNVADRLHFVHTHKHAPELGLANERSLGFDLVVANPPYVTASEMNDLMPDVVHHEPHVALLGGEDGLDVIRPLCQVAARLLKRPGTFLCEVGHTQSVEVAAMLRPLLEQIVIVQDLSGHGRVVQAFKMANLQ